jgi:hypothetical protein
VNLPLIIAKILATTITLVMVSVAVYEFLKGLSE